MSPSTAKCKSCGLSNLNSVFPGDLCSECTLDGNFPPDFESIVYAMSLGYVIKVDKITDAKLAVTRAYEYISRLVFWQDKPIPSLNEVLKHFDQARILRGLYLKGTNLRQDALINIKYDYFISHCWDGPDEAFVENFVLSLKKLGYKVWYDQDNWKDSSGRVDTFIENGIINSDNYVIFWCQEYFNSPSCLDELEKICHEKVEEPLKKFIFPIWGSNMNQGDFNDPILLADQVNHRLHGIDRNKLPTLRISEIFIDHKCMINKFEVHTNLVWGKKPYNQVLLTNSEAKALEILEKLIKEPIPSINIDSKDEFGFSHQDGHVIKLNFLGKLKHDWKIPVIRLPEATLRFQELEVLMARLNDIPDWIHEFQELKELVVNEGTFTTLPLSIGNLNNLHRLNLFNNKIASLPDSIGDLKSLKDLDLSGNQLNSVPQSIENLTSLQILNLSFNSFSVFPECLGKLSALEKLRISNNLLRSLPESFGDLRSLKVLDLHSNQLISLPLSFGNLTSLESLDLYNNDLSSLPESLGNLRTLRILDLHGIKLSAFPEKTKKNLVLLWCAGCKILNEDPEDIFF